MFTIVVSEALEKRRVKWRSPVFIFIFVSSSLVQFEVSLWERTCLFVSFQWTLKQVT